MTGLLDYQAPVGILRVRDQDRQRQRQLRRGGGAKHGTNWSAFRPHQTRSRFAAFDPGRRGSADILASAIPIGLIGGGMYYGADDDGL